MSKTYFHLSNLLVLTCLLSGNSAQSFDYFNQAIDFWSKPALPHGVVPRRTSGADRRPLVELPVQPEKTSFPWEKYLSPDRVEFFKEGDYTPPEPFMEIVRNPTDQNLKMWFSYMDKKNELQTRLQARVKEYLAKEGGKIEAPAREVMMDRAKPINTPEPETRRYRFRMYFDSTCPHCKRMFGTLADLQARGFFVEAHQVDTGSLQGFVATVPVVKADPKEIRQKGIESVPLLMIGDLKQKVVYRLKGYQTTQDVFQAIHQGNSQAQGVSMSSP